MAFDKHDLGRGELFARAESLMRERVFPTALERDRTVADALPLLREAHKAGLYAAFVPREFGGYGLTLSQACDLAFQLSRHSLDLPWVSSFAASAFVAVDQIVNFAAPERKRDLLNATVAQGINFCIANAESGSGSNPLGMKSSVTEGDENTRLTGVKHCATNATIADFIFVSAKTEATPHTTFDVFLLPRDLVRITPLESKMMGFRTGSTGRVDFSLENVSRERYQFGGRESGAAQFKRCFDIERLFLSALVAGLLQGVEDCAVQFLKEKEKHQLKFSDRQYIQQKLLVIFAAKEKIWSLVERVAASGRPEYHRQQLGLMKWLATSSSLTAALAYLEIVGQNGFFADHVAQKLIRDLVGVRFFGGSMELQKMAIFGQFEIESARSAARRAG